MPGIVNPNNDNLVQVAAASVVNSSGVLVLLDGAAVVQMTATDIEGVALAGEIWPVTLSYLGSGGNFQGVLRDTIVWPAVWSEALLIVTINNGADQYGELTDTLTIIKREI